MVKLSANRAAAAEDDNGFSLLIAQGTEISRAAYGLRQASIIHAVINNIIYDSFDELFRNI